MVFGALAAICHAAPAPAPAGDKELLAREPLSFPKLPGYPGGGMPSIPGMPSFTNNQQNQCSGGEPYCCNSDQGGSTNCAKASGICSTTVICCNNNFGVSILFCQTWSGAGLLFVPR